MTTVANGVPRNAPPPAATPPKAPAPGSAPPGAPPSSARAGWFQDTFSTKSGGGRPPVDLGGTSKAAVLPELQPPPDAGNTGKAPKVLAKSIDEDAPEISGEDRAKQDVNVQTAGDDKDSVLKTQKSLREETSRAADDLINGKGQLPPDAKVNKINDNEAELVRTDKSGNVIERTVARRGEDGSASLDSTSYKDGVNTHTMTESLADGGSRVRKAEWKSDASEIGDQPSFEELEKSRDAKYTFSDNRVGEKNDQGEWVKAGEGQLTVDEYAQSAGTVKGSQTTYSTEKGGGAIDDKLKGPFKLDQDMDRATTHSYSIPAPGSDGQQGPPEYQKIDRFSQGDTQATAIVNSELLDDAHDTSMIETSIPVADNYKNYVREAGEGNHTREDLNKVRDAHSDFWGGNFDADRAADLGTPPKRWLVETKPDENTYRSQTFMEGAPKASIVTERKLNGNEVTEQYGGKAFSPDGKDLVDVSGKSTSTYGADGKLDKLDTTRKDRDGSRQEHHYTRSTENTPEGTKHTEKTDSKVWDKDDKETHSLQEKVSLDTPEGGKDLSYRNEVTGPAGTAIHEVNEQGDRLTFKDAQGEARDITDHSQFQNEDEENLAVTAAAASKAMSEAGVVASSLGGKMPKAEGAIGAEKITSSLDKAKGATKVFEGLVGATGVIGASVSLHQAIQDKDRAAQGLASLQLAGSSLELTSAASAANKALAGLSAFERLGTAGAVLGGAATIWDGAQNIDKGLEAGLGGKVAQGAVDIVAGTAGIGAALLGAPVIGAVIGVVGFGVKSLIGLINDDEHKISELSIDDEGFSVPQEPPPPTPEQIQQQEEEREHERELTLDTFQIIG